MLNKRLFQSTEILANSYGSINTIVVGHITESLMKIANFNKLKSEDRVYAVFKSISLTYLRYLGLKLLKVL